MSKFDFEQIGFQDAADIRLVQRNFERIEIKAVTEQSILSLLASLAGIQAIVRTNPSATVTARCGATIVTAPAVDGVAVLRLLNYGTWEFEASDGEAVSGIAEMEITIVKQYELSLYVQYPNSYAGDAWAGSSYL